MPRGTRAMAQVSDGRFFVGSAAGLSTFNGIRNQLAGIQGESEFQSTRIHAMCVGANDDIWVGFEAGGVSRYLNVDVENHLPGAGPPTGQVWALACVAESNTVWVATDGGLAKWNSNQWEAISRAELPAVPVTGVHISRDGSLWAAAAGKLFHRAPDSTAFELVGSLGNTDHLTTPFAETADGSIWVGTNLGTFRVHRQTGEGQSIRLFHSAPVSSLLVDRDDVLWAGGEGLMRFVTPAEASSIQKMRYEDGLSGVKVYSLAQDLDGNIWVATSGGIDRFKHPTFIAADMAPGLDGDKVLVADSHRGLWAADRDRGRAMFYFEGKLRQTVKVPSPEIGHRGADGSIWFAGKDGISQLQGGRFITEPLPEQAREGQVRALDLDGAGVLWISVHPHGVFRKKGGAWIAAAGSDHLPEGAPSAMQRDATGALWLGYPAGKVVRIREGSVQTFSAGELPDMGAVLAMRASGSRIWIAGDKSLVVHDGHKFHNVWNSNCGLLQGTLDLHEQAGGLWIYRAFSIAWFRNGVQESLDGKKLICTSLQQPLVETIGGMLQFSSTGAPLAGTSDGRVWMVVGGNLAWTTPERTSRRSDPPFVTIDAIRDDATHQIGEGPRFRPGVRTLRVEFTGWYLGSPEAVRFEYRLIGLDESWSGPATDVAFFGNLRPGEYRFEVRAWGPSLERGPVASRSFVILPYFHETWWFAALCVLAGLILLGLLFRMQLRRANARLRERLEERTLERERIARELHDTLLQGMQGIILRFQAVAASITGSQPAASQMEELLDRADAVLAESRDRVAELRNIPPQTSELPEAIAELLSTITKDQDVNISSGTTGQVRALDGSVNAEVFMIAREAISNALRHSECRVLETELVYERSWLRLRVRDDGRGIPEDVLREGGRTGHFGLAGMRERAKRLRGTLRISSQPGAGSEIELRIPASLAYARETAG